MHNNSGVKVILFQSISHVSIMWKSITINVEIHKPEILWKSINIIPLSSTMPNHIFLVFHHQTTFLIQDMVWYKMWYTMVLPNHIVLPNHMYQTTSCIKNVVWCGTPYTMLLPNHILYQTTLPFCVNNILYQTILLKLHKGNCLHFEGFKHLLPYSQIPHHHSIFIQEI